MVLTEAIEFICYGVITNKALNKFSCKSVSFLPLPVA